MVALACASMVLVSRVIAGASPVSRLVDRLDLGSLIRAAWKSGRDRADTNIAHERASAAEAAKETQQAIVEAADERSARDEADTPLLGACEDVKAPPLAAVRTVLAQDMPSASILNASMVVSTCE